MLTDAHCHPFDLAQTFAGGEAERRRMGVMCAASASAPEEFAFCADLSRAAAAAAAPPLLPCFAVHPQMCAAWAGGAAAAALRTGIARLEELAAGRHLAAVGETGFDLFNAAFRVTEHMQDELFSAHLETAVRYGLPLVLHVRRAMHKIFACAGSLKKCPAVVFHSWPGTAGEGAALLRRGVNAFFSFGSAVHLNHREAMRCCAALPLERLLSETDAPYQPLRGAAFSSFADLPRIIAAVAALRRDSGCGGGDAAELEKTIESNFRRAFMLPAPVCSVQAGAGFRGTGQVFPAHGGAG